MLSPQKFAKETNLSYQQVLTMCKKGEIEVIQTEGGHFKIHDSELEKFLDKKDFISRESYEEILRENERLRTMLSQLKILVNEIS